MTHITCECGCIVTKKYYPNHVETKKHKTLMKKKQPITEVSKKEPEIEASQTVEKKQEPRIDIETLDKKKVKKCLALISIVENNGTLGVHCDENIIKEITKKIISDYTIYERAAAVGLFKKQNMSK